MSFTLSSHSSEGHAFLKEPVYIHSIKITDQGSGLVVVSVDA